MHSYDEQQVLAFTDDVIAAYLRADVIPDKRAATWVGRMQFDAVTMGYPAARAKHLADVWSGLPISHLVRRIERIEHEVFHGRIPALERGY